MKMNKSILISLALVVALAVTARAKNTFVIYDGMLRLPALCFRLDNDWEGMGWIGWSLKSDTKYHASVILMSPTRHMLIQDLGPMFQYSEIFHPQRLAVYQNPMAMAQDLANSFNASIVVPGLSSFSATDARWTQDVPQLTRIYAQAMKRPSNTVNTFGFVGKFACLYGGVRCEALYTMSLAVCVYPAVRRTMPSFGTAIRVNPRVILAPVGHLDDARRECGRMLGSVFVNNIWSVQRDRTLAARVQGTIIGREAGWNLWMESQKNMSETLERVRKARSEQIREVKTVDNPLSPGTKIERPAFFENAWLNSAQDKLLLSDRNLEPNIIRPLMEQGEWVAIQ